MKKLRLHLPVLLLAGLAILPATVAVLSCATTKGAASAVASACAEEVAPFIVDVVREASFSKAEADLPTILEGLKDCLARLAAQQVSAELAKLGAAPAAADPSAGMPVPVATARRRLDEWLARHPAVSQRWPGEDPLPLVCAAPERLDAAALVRRVRPTPSPTCPS